MKITGIAASLHAGSFINRLLDAAGGELPVGVRLTRWDGLRDIPPYVPRHAAGRLPEPVRDLVRAVAGSDGVLLTAPEHSLLPAELAHALDWLTAAGELSGRHVAVMSASARACGAMWAQAELYKRLLEAGAVVMGGELVISPDCRHFEDDGRLAPSYLRDQVVGVLAQLCQAPVHARLHTPVPEAVPGPVPASVREPVREPVGESVRESVRDSVRESVRESVRDSVCEPAAMAGPLAGPLAVREPAPLVREPALSR
ncbi:NAD(P)H-dependent oxidoreductase [Nonomuraea pusilla]|uniref:NADPH-dependent FMN reductase n=1 Tax=Nonomuraea pusilla TaxID=46177 RepID=UPI003318C079